MKRFVVWVKKRVGSSNILFRYLEPCRVRSFLLWFKKYNSFVCFPEVLKLETANGQIKPTYPSILNLMVPCTIIFSFGITIVSSVGIMNIRFSGCFVIHDIIDDISDHIIVVVLSNVNVIRKVGVLLPTKIYQMAIFTAQKMKFSIRNFFIKCDKSSISCGFGHIY